MRPLHVFNGPVEVGFRTLVLLLEAAPDALDLQRLVVFDYLLVHSGDIAGGPTSLHAPSPLRAGEVAVRRGLIEDGLHLYGSRGLLAQRVGPAGIRYVAEDRAAALLDAMVTPLAVALRQRARWLFDTYGSMDDLELRAVLSESLGRWHTEFAPLEVEEEAS